MDHRSKMIVAVGVTAILVSIGVFIALYSDNEHRILFVTDPDDLAKYFEIVDDDTGKRSAIEKGAEVFDRSTIRSVAPDIKWTDQPKISDNNTVVCSCIIGGATKKIMLWIHGAELLGAEMSDDVLYVHVTDTVFNFALAFSIHDP